MIDTYILLTIIAAILGGISAISWISLAIAVELDGPVALITVCWITGILTGIAAIVLAIICGGYHNAIKFSIPDSHHIVIS